MKVSILTSEESWFVPNAVVLRDNLIREGYECDLQFTDRDIADDVEIVFILSYFSLVSKEFLSKHKHNLVVHDSDLPQGKGWSPATWQILEGKNRLPIVIFEATEQVDSGRIYIKDYIELDGSELLDEIRQRQAGKIYDLCTQFLYTRPVGRPQLDCEDKSNYRRRSAVDSELDVDKTILEQFNLLRTVDNKAYPAFFNIKGHKYILRISKDENH